MSFKAFADQIIQDQIQFRRKLHRIAEQSGQEHQTSEAVREYLSATDPDEMITDIGGEGLAAVYDGREEGPTVMIRCELDALPIEETNDFEHRSQNDGTSHKCGHDGHMSIVTGIGRYLKDHRPENGRVILLFQPAEETGRGALRILDDEKFEAIEPDYIFALHNLPGFPKHQIIVRDDVFAAASIGLMVRLKGETSHAAHPYEGRSPALAMAQIIETFSAIPQFYTSLSDTAKVTLIHTKLGEKAFGTSPGFAEIATTLRTYNDDEMNKLEQKAIELAGGIADTYDLEMEYETTEPFKATVNEKSANDLLKEVVKSFDYEMEIPATPFAWSEDFGQLLNQYKGALFGLGSGEQHPQLHASHYDFPDEIIHTGLVMFLGVIDRLTNIED